MSGQRSGGPIGVLAAALPWRAIRLAAIAGGLGFVLLADYPMPALGALVALLFAAYVWLRCLVFFDNDRFTPRRHRVSLTWALVGIDDTAKEFDYRPVRVYFVLLAILFCGTVLRPVLQWVLG